MKNRKVFSFLVALQLLVSACTTVPESPESVQFQHEFTASAVPWTHDEFDNNSDKFTFALFSDLTGGEREGVFEQAVEQLNLLRPELIVSVGDLILGGTEDRRQTKKEFDDFDERATRARAPVFHVGGNHDLTNPVMWEVWEQRYGKRYYHFIYKNVLFLVLDTEDSPAAYQQQLHELRIEAVRVLKKYGRGEELRNTEYAKREESKSGRIGEQQAAYFRDVIANNPNVRWTFLMMHKAAWERTDEENFSTIEAALSQRPYTVFHGHLHSYKHQQRHGRDYIRLGTTGGAHPPDDDMAIDHVSMVTIGDTQPDIANLRLSGIFDKTGKIPFNGEQRCLEMCNKKNDPNQSGN